MIKYKSKIRKIPNLTKYTIEIYFSRKYDQIADFIYYHLIDKYPNIEFYRSYSNNKKGIDFGIESVNKTKAEQIKKYLDKLVIGALP